MAEVDAYEKTKGVVDCTVPADLEKLRGKTILITGGSSGLGAEYVKVFACAGAYITNADLKEPAEWPSALSPYHYQHIKCDVTSWKDQLEAFKSAIAKSPRKRIDIVVANAGITGSDPIWELDKTDDPKEPDLKIIKIDFLGVAYTAKLAMHYFAKQADSPSGDKCLILKSSLAGYMDMVGSPSYGSSKYAVRGLMHQLRRSGRMRVNVIAPWFVATRILSEAVVQVLGEKLVALGSDWALPEDCARAVMRVATDKSINGRALGVLPKKNHENAVFDMETDDYQEGTLLAKLQNMTAAMAHRTLPKNVQ